MRPRAPAEPGVGALPNQHPQRPALLGDAPAHLGNAMATLSPTLSPPSRHFTAPVTGWGWFNPPAAPQGWVGVWLHQDPWGAAARGCKHPQAQRGHPCVTAGTARSWDTLEEPQSVPQPQGHQCGGTPLGGECHQGWILLTPLRAFPGCEAEIWGRGPRAASPPAAASLPAQRDSKKPG